MAESEDFFTELIDAVDKKTDWYDHIELPRLLSEFRDLQSNVSSLIQSLLKKGLITEDPYKNDKKISDIIVPDSSPFNDTERAMVIGARLSDYDSMLDFVCNYMRFSVDSLTPDRIKKLVALNTCFSFSDLTVTSPKPNTRGLAEIFSLIKNGNDMMAMRIIQDSINHTSTCINNINTILKGLTEFQKEVYKCNVRRTIFTLPDFGQNATNSSSLLSFLKKNFPHAMKGKPFYSDLVEEIIQEEFADNKADLRAAVLSKLDVRAKETKKKEKAINPKDFLVDAVRTLASLAPQLEKVATKFEENKNVLESEHNSFFDKLKVFLRKTFNIEDEPITYRITIIEPLTQAKRYENIDFVSFCANITKRANFYSAYAAHTSPQFQKLMQMTEPKILEFLTTQLSECQKLIVQFGALDEYFKNTPQPANRARIRGIKMEITALNNTLVKTNQRRADYNAIIEERTQLEKLGIKNV